jgi:hypothetical protein
VTIPISELTAVLNAVTGGSAENVNVKITSAAGEVTLDKGAVETLITKAQEAGVAAEESKLVIERKETEALPSEQKAALSGSDVREVYDISMYAVTGSGNVPLDFVIEASDDGKLTIGLPCALNPGEAAEGVIVLYVSDDGSKSRMTDTKYDAEKELAVFTTSHLSLYSVIYETPAVEDNQPNDNIGNEGGNSSSSSSGGGGCDTGMAGFALLVFALFSARAADKRKGKK